MKDLQSCLDKAQEKKAKKKKKQGDNLQTSNYLFLIYFCVVSQITIANCDDLYFWPPCCIFMKELQDNFTLLFINCVKFQIQACSVFSNVEMKPDTINPVFILPRCIVKLKKEHLKQQNHSKWLVQKWTEMSKKKKSLYKTCCNLVQYNI